MSAGGGGTDQDVELNIAPIIDCFTVLITYLLVSASFISLKAIESGITSSGPAEAAPPPVDQPLLDPPLSLAIQLNPAKKIEIQLTGGAQKLDLKVPVDSKDSLNWDLESLKARLDQIKEKWPTIKEVNLSAEPTIVYREIIQVLETSKKVFPKAFLAG